MIRGAAWRILRPLNACTAAAGVVVGMMLWGLSPSWQRVWFLAPASAALITAFGNVLNDIQDAELDRVAHPARALPAGLITLAAARRLATALAILGPTLALLAGGPLLALAAAAVLGALFCYERFLKAQGFVGNLVVAALTGCTFLYGALAARIHETYPARWPIQAAFWAGPTGDDFWGVMVVGTAVMAFLLNVAREVVKDIEDMEGDRGQRVTLALRYGVGPARWVAVLAIVGAVPICLFFAAAGWLLGQGGPDAQAWGMAAAVPLAAAALVAMAGGALVFFHARRAQVAFKVGMLLAVVGLALLGIAMHDALAPRV
jgi:geranylgeranylglycerol-phosphate geranylgeranyltransferase